MPFLDCGDSCDCNVLTESVRFNWRNEVRSCAETGPEAVLGDRELTLPVVGADSRSVLYRRDHISMYRIVRRFSIYNRVGVSLVCEHVKRDFPFW